MSYAAYAGVQRAAENGRDLEFRAISHVTRQLVDANKPGADAMGRIRALNGNIRLWALLTKDLANPANGLPENVKAGYIRLGKFSTRASVAALTGKYDLSPLIKINTDVLEALDQQRALAA